MSTAPQPTPNSEPLKEQPQPQVLPPTPAPLPAPPGGAYSVVQTTHINPQLLPPHVWTYELADKYLTLLKQEGDDIRKSMAGFQKREYGMWIFGMVAVIGIVATGLVFMAKGIPGGQQIILGTLSFAAGLLAGRKFSK
jgi:hypothetical protein